MDIIVSRQINSNFKTLTQFPFSSFHSLIKMVEVSKEIVGPTEISLKLSIH